METILKEKILKDSILSDCKVRIDSNTIITDMEDKETAKIEFSYNIDDNWLNLTIESNMKMKVTMVLKDAISGIIIKENSFKVSSGISGIKTIVKSLYFEGKKFDAKVVNLTFSKIFELGDSKIKITVK